MKKTVQNTNTNQPKGKASLLTGALGIVAILAVVALVAFMFVSGAKTDPSYFTIEDGVLTAYEGDDRVVTIPEGVVVIGDRAFMNHEEIEKVVMPQTLTTLRNGAFYRCTSLTEIKFSRELNFIGDAAFGECTAMTEFTLPASVQYLHSEAFYGASGLTAFAVEEGSEHYQAIDGVIYTADGKTLVLYPAGRQDNHFSVPAEVEVISVGAFANNAVLETVDLGNVVEIGERAFEYCTALHTLAIPASAVEIYDDAFNGCTALKDLSFAEGLAVIGVNAFGGCTALEVVTLPESMTDLKNNAFAYCTALTEVHIPAEFEGLYEGAFEGSEAVTLYSAAGAPAEVFAETYDIPFIAE